ncbi:MAG: J domain-containing protein [Polyangiaceae bacterium]|nr:J domain-containing protein [Polyangiaceae bacterium]
MHLPGRLRSTSLGDLLGSAHRIGATGTLELVEDRGRVHRVYLAGGLVVAVELDGDSPPLAEILRQLGGSDEGVLRRSLLRALASRRLHGEVLVDDFFVAPEVVGRALRRQAVARLTILERVPDARVAFRVTVRPPRGALVGRRAAAPGKESWDAPVGPHEFLHGRRRARDRATAPVRAAWDTLGLPPGAPVGDVKRAYKRLARSVHPDLHPNADESARRALQARFAALTEAYRALIEAA